MVFAQHQFEAFLGIFIVSRLCLLLCEVGFLRHAVLELNQGNDGVVHDCHKLGHDAFVDHCLALHLNGANAVGLDEYLVGKRLGAHDAPRRSIVVQFFAKQFAAVCHYLLKLLLGGEVRHIIKRVKYEGQ